MLRIRVNKHPNGTAKRMMPNILPFQYHHQSIVQFWICSSCFFIWRSIRISQWSDTRYKTSTISNHSNSTTTQTENYNDFRLLLLISIVFKKKKNPIYRYHWKIKKKKWLWFVRFLYNIKIWFIISILMHIRRDRHSPIKWQWEL